MLKIHELPPDWQRNEFMGLNVATERAVHQILEHPKIFDDPLALRIIGTNAESKLRSRLAEFENPDQRRFRAGVMVRNRYTEDELARSIAGGIRQYVILGAGLDTFAYRNPFPLLRVFEVDHPATQAWKRDTLEKAGIDIPSSITYVPVDFERQSIADALGRSGFRANELTFISFIGVLRYLSGEAFKSILTGIISVTPAGSEIVFDVGPAPSILETVRGQARPGRTESLFESSWSASVPQRLRRRISQIISSARSDNDFLPTYFDLPSLTRDLKRVGFTDVEFVTPGDLNLRYCNGRTDGLRIGNQMYLVKARI
jgi:methyltransferase (TIGR00027 family)